MLKKLRSRLTISAVIVRANGETEDLGVIAESSFWRRAARWLTYLLIPGIGATLIVNTGRAIVTNRLVAGTLPPIFIAWGTGAGTTAATDTTLFTEASEARVSAAATQQQTTTLNDTYQLVAAFTANAGKTITNVGAFDASSAGNLFFKSDFTGLALNLGDGITFTIKVNFA